MNILITGKADKRPIVYPLLYSLNLLGSTLFLTNNTAYRRLLNTTTDEIGNTCIEITSGGNEILEEFYKVLSPDYEHTVIDTFEETALSENGVNINVIRDGEESKKGLFIRVGYEPPKEKEFFIPLNDSLYRQIYKIELNSRFAPIKDPQTLKTLTSVFAPIFGKSEKDMKKLLLYKGGRLT